MRTLNISRSSSNISSIQYNNNNNYYLYRNNNNTINNNNSNNNIQKSASEIISKRGFKPSDCKDPNKKNFLTSLSTKLWKIGTEPDRQDDQRRKPSSNLHQLFNIETQNKDQKFHPQRNNCRKMYASSSFYSSNHPTVQEQLEMARRISSSLSDISNRRSKGQSMYENRKKRSVRWVHEGEGRAPFPSDELYVNQQEETGHKGTLKLIMNPRGKVQDLQSLRKQGYNIEENALSPEVCFDLVRDMNATTGKGAELFAKRRKKSENWIIGGENNSPATSTISSSMSYSETIQTNNVERKQITQSTNCSIKSDVTNNFTSTVYKPKIPQGWNTQINPSPSQIHDMTKDHEIKSQSQYRDYLSMNNYNTAPRGWQSTMRYYKPVLLNPTHSDY